MSVSVTRKFDICTGHGCWGSRPNDEASADVFVNGLGVHREGDHWVTHCCVSCHDGILSKGHNTIFVNGRRMSVQGAPISCGSSVLTGSPDVFASFDV